MAKGLMAFVLAVVMAVVCRAETNTYDATVLRVIDGDTVEANISLGFGITMTSHCRMYGINTPELHGNNATNAVIAKTFLYYKVRGKSLKLCTLDDRRDKYGRILAILIVDGVNINQLMLDRKFAVPMDDGGKVMP